MKDLIDNLGSRIILLVLWRMWPGGDRKSFVVANELISGSACIGTMNRLALVVENKPPICPLDFSILFNEFTLVRQCSEPPPL